MAGAGNWRQLRHPEKSFAGCRIHFDHIVVPTLVVADVGRRSLCPGRAAVGGHKNAEISAGTLAAIGNRGVNRIARRVAGGNAKVNAAHGERRGLLSDATESDAAAGSGVGVRGSVDAIRVSSSRGGAERTSQGGVSDA